MAVFNVAELIEERRRWPVINSVITASPRAPTIIFQISEQNFERKAPSDEKTVPVAWLD